MDFSKISRADMVRLMKLIEKKEQLQAQIDAIDRELRAGGSSEAVASPNAPTKRKPRTSKPSVTGDAGASPRRGAVRDAIIAILQASGPDGITAKEIAEKLGKPPGHIHTWFSITGKGVPNIRKLGGGRWGWSVTDAPAT